MASKTKVKLKNIMYMSKQEEYAPREIELTEEIGQGEYANMVLAVHSPTEFVLDFVRIMPGVEKMKVKSRVILAPDTAKRMLEVLSNNIRIYEENFGEISLVEEEPPVVGRKGDA